MIYDIAENPQSTGKCVKYDPAAWGLRKVVSLGAALRSSSPKARSHISYNINIWDQQDSHLHLALGLLISLVKAP